MAASCASERRAACSLQDLRSGTLHPRGDPGNDPETLAHVREEEEGEEEAARLAQAPVMLGARGRGAGGGLDPTWEERASLPATSCCGPSRGPEK